MRTRQRIADDFNKRQGAGQVGLGVHERQLELEAIMLEVLLDIRDLLQQPPCNCAVTKTDGESEHWPTCRYA